jgi:hypothetical protein
MKEKFFSIEMKCEDTLIYFYMHVAEVMARYDSLSDWAWECGIHEEKKYNETITIKRIK